MTVALTHAAGAALARCEVTFVDRQPIDVERARAQHAGYRALLEACGAEVRVVDVSPGHPDAVFVEDAVVVLDEVAVATAMGASSRRGEVANLAPVVAGYRPVARIEPPGTLEGGDVLRVGRRLYVGRSVRTNEAGIAAFAQIVAPFGYEVVPVEVRGCLHLKTACTALDEETLLANPEWMALAPFAGMRVVAVDAAEPFAANTLRIGETICASAAHPRSIEAVRALGYAVRTVDISELEKAEAGVTCLSVVFPKSTSLVPGTRDVLFRERPGVPE